MTAASPRSAAVLAAVVLACAPALAAKAKKKSAGLDPTAARLMSEGLAALDRGQVSSAIALFEHAARRQPGERSYFLLGWAQARRAFKAGSIEEADRDDAQSAVDAYKMALAKDPKLAELTRPSRLYQSLGRCEEALGAFPRALNAYKLALNADPGNAEVALDAARLRLKMKDEDKAVSNARKALIKARAAGRAADLRARVADDPMYALLMADPRVREAIGASPALAASNAPDPDLRDSVSDAPRPAAAPPPQDAKTLDMISRGDAAADRADWTRAAAFYRAAIDADARARTLTAAQSASLWESLGAADNELGDSAAAASALMRSVEIVPRARAYYQLAKAQAEAGRIAAALSALDGAFASASGPDELRRFVLLAKTDLQLVAVRDLPGYREEMAKLAPRVALR